MLLTRHYNQRPFDETVCDAIIANSGVKNRQKRCKMFVMMDASNMVQIFVACAIQGIRFSSINCLRWGGTKEMGCQMKACVMYNIQFTRLNCLWWGATTEMGSQMKVCAIYSTQFARINCLWLGNTKRNGQLDEGVCDIRLTVHSNELFALSQENRNGST